ncbi:radical SAM family heme chaperone HemW [Moraxella atlantae]|uniref:Heme chaperone HemW n=1 Tax=Faucicola atlantae TaxID=34059 RepID=A0A378Q3K4_9GAMM|nr:radical SAM family heme chaperone HemW [Moraxella atlantae]STY94994.1 Oxygen-independent coproporphyrinogen-III oxidase [Moraxella atlantae]
MPNTTSPHSSILNPVVLQSANVPLALYIHVPWCVKKCPYCDFNSHTLNGQADFAAYADALLQDLDSQLPWVQGRVVSSIFIGGGTPSLMPIAAYARLFDGIAKRLRLSDDCEITLEANPATVEHAPFAEYLNLGINRLSLGVQSFASDKLQALGRIHSRVQAIAAVKAAQDAGFSRLNIDLMHGLPQQTLADALADLQQAFDLRVPHISWYQLTIEPNTVFYRTPPTLPDDDALDEIGEQGAVLLQAHGLMQYEVSAWAQTSDQQCRHNLNYWQFGDYLAIGAGAHAKITTPDGIFRFSKTRLPKDYLTPHGTQGKVGWQRIDENALAFEFMLNALRLKNGVPRDLWQARTGLAFDTIAPTLARLIAQGLMADDRARIRCTDTGFLFLNRVLGEFLPETANLQTANPQTA